VKILIVEDDFTSRLFLREMLKSYGPVHVSVNGKEAVEAVRRAVEAGEPYDLICLDIMMPQMDGHQALRQIREIEKHDAVSAPRAKIIMTSALADKANVIRAARSECDHFLVKPIERTTLIGAMRKLRLIP